MKLLTRLEPLQHCHMFDESDRRVALIEARAGQGKTTLVAQYEAQTTRYVQHVICRARHRDPAVLGEVLLQFIHRDDERHHREVVSRLHQQVLPVEIPAHTATVLAEEFNTASSPRTLILDDAHELAESPSCLLLRQLITSTGPHLRLMLVSRHPVLHGETPVFPRKDCFLFDNELLAFSREEVATLFNDCYEIPVDAGTISRLMHSTEGWAAGLRLLRNDLHDIPELLHPNALTNLDTFFSRQPALAELTHEQRRRFSMLAMLQTMPTELLLHLDMHFELTLLRHMAAINFFVHEDNRARTPSFVFHNLFQAFLRREALPLATDNAENMLLRTAAQWHLDRGEREISLQYLVDAHDWLRLEEVMATCGPKLLAENKVDTILALLVTLPAEVQERSLFLLLAGLAHVAHCSPEAAPILRRAIRAAHTANNPVWELLACCGILTQHMLLGTRLEDLHRILDRAATLFEQTRHNLPDQMTIQCACAISSTYSHTFGRLDKSRKFASIASEVHARSGSTRKSYQTLMAHILSDLIHGNIPSVIDSFEDVFSIRNDSTYARQEQFLVETLHLNVVEMAGLFHNYEHEKADFISRFSQILQFSYIQDFFDVWDLDILIARGAADKALARARDLAHNPAMAGQPHLLSQILHYKALAMALCGQHDGLMDTVRLSLRLRARSPKRYFLALNRIMLGAALSLTPFCATGLRMLHRGQHLCEDIEEHFCKAGALFHQAVYRLRQDDTQTALPLIRQWLTGMQTFANQHFFGLSPSLLAEVLQAAMRNNIHRSFARKLARTRLHADLLDDGSLVPLLHVNDIGPLHLECADRMLSGTKLGGTSRALLSLLAEGTRHSLPVDELAQALWPDSTIDKARTTFDTALSRLRTALNRAFGPGSGKQYLQTRQGVLRLCHCTIASKIVLREAKDGLALARNGCPWQACGAFERMAPLLQSAAGNNTSLTFSLQDWDLLLAAQVKWIDLLVQSGLQDQALHAANQAIAISPTAEQPQRRRYDILTTLKRPKDAMDGLRRFRHSLTGEGFTEPEISDIMEQLFK